MAAKVALVIILDVGPAMCQAAPGHETPLETSVKAIKMILTRKMFTCPKDEVALVLFGTEETDNPLADGNGYENIAVVRNFMPPDLELLQYVHDSIIPGNQPADFVDAIVVATQLLNEATLGKKFEKNMMLFSNLGSPFGDDGLDDIIGGVKDLETNFTIVGPNLYDDDDSDDQGGDDDDDDENTPGPRVGGIYTKPKSAQQKLGEKCIKHILVETSGQTFTLSNILPMLAFVEQKAIRQNTVFRGPLQIGSNIKINVHGYIRVKEQKPDTWKKLSAPAEASAEPGNMGVKLQRSYHLKDEDETEVDQADLAKGFRYGKTLVPFLKIDQQSMKLESDKCLDVLCFTPSSTIKREQYIGDNVVAFVPQPDDQAAAIGLSAIIRALYESDKVAVVRYVWRNKAAPRIGVLTPHIKENYECLLYTALPFAEDIRQFTFASLPSTSKQEPSDEQLEAVEDLIDSMLLTEEKSGRNDQVDEALKLKQIFNPYRQRLFQCIVHRSLNPEEPLPDIDPVIARSIEQPSRLQVHSAPHLMKLKNLFPLEVVSKKKSEKKEENVFKTRKRKRHQDETLVDDTIKVPLERKLRLSYLKEHLKCIDLDLDVDSRGPKRLKRDDDEAGTSMGDLAKSEITEVGTVDPVGDFTYLVNQKDVDRFGDASKQMKDRILRLIMDSFKDEFYNKAISCIHALRKESIKAAESQMFNSFLDNLKEQLQMKNSFWERLKKEKVTLINNKESSDVDVTEEKARAFLEDVDKKTEAKNEEEVEDVDELLEMMG